MTKIFSVRCYAGDGSMMGSILENDFNKPLSRREANARCTFENERSEKRRAQKLAGAFYFKVAGWIQETGKHFI